MASSPPNSFQRCPNCGQFPLIYESNKKVTCKNCQFTYYFNPSAAVGAIILNQKGEILLSQRKKEPAKGLFDLPGGFVNIGEAAEDAVVREIHEELNLKVTKSTFLLSSPNIYQYKNIVYYPLDLFFRVEIEDFSYLKAQDDVADISWLAPGKIQREMIAFESVWNAINSLQEKSYQ